MSRPLRIGTRASALALAQARAVAALLGVPAELVEVATSGDRSAAAGAQALDGRGVFIKELELALLRGDVDLCVHSAKDVPPEVAEGLELAAYPPREDPRDVLAGRSLAQLAPGSRVATGSPRRAAQLLALAPGVRVEPIRGNVDSRLGRVAAGGFDAAVLALAGLRRLGRAAEASQILEPWQMVPAAGQGALAIEVRSGDARARGAAAAAGDPLTAFCVTVERSVLAALGEGCSAPAGVLCAPAPDGRSVRAVAAVARPDGRIVRADGSQAAAERGGFGDAEDLAGRIVAALRAQGADFQPADGRGAGAMP